MQFLMLAKVTKSNHFKIVCLIYQPINLTISFSFPAKDNQQIFRNLNFTFSFQLRICVFKADVYYYYYHCYFFFFLFFRLRIWNKRIFARFASLSKNRVYWSFNSLIYSILVKQVLFVVDPEIFLRNLLAFQK